jgi:protein TonB
MAKLTVDKKPEFVRGSQLGLDERPAEYTFGFESAKSKVGAGTSVLTHLAVLGVLLLILRFAPQALPPEIADQLHVDMAVFLPTPTPGPGGGGGGGGDVKPQPVRKAQVEQKKDPISIPAAVTPTPTPPKIEEPPPIELTVPFKSMSGAEMTLPGIVSPSAPTTGGAGSGPGTGAGSGQGSGVGPGYGGGFGGGAFRPGSGVTLPQPLREVRPAYTADAMRARVQGSVWVECIVMPDGNVGEVKVTRSLDPVFGLDQEAIRAAKMWRFRPGTRQGEPVAVIITIELMFTLR